MFYPLLVRESRVLVGVSWQVQFSAFNPTLYGHLYLLPSVGCSLMWNEEGFQILPQDPGETLHAREIYLPNLGNSCKIVLLFLPFWSDPLVYCGLRGDLGWKAATNQGN